MQPIEQLKSMRMAAENRLSAHPDYRLLVSLEALIEDLEALGQLNLTVIADEGSKEEAADTPDVASIGREGEIALSELAGDGDDASDWPAAEEPATQFG